MRGHRNRRLPAPAEAARDLRFLSARRNRVSASQMPLQIRRCAFPDFEVWRCWP